MTVAATGTGNRVMTSGVSKVKDELRWANNGLSTDRLELTSAYASKLTGTSWYTGSDQRLKEDIQTADYEQCYTTTSNLELRRFAWRSDIKDYDAVPDRRVLGWIAQEVQPHFPKAVETVAARGYSDMLVLNSDQLYANMYGTIKYLMAKIETQYSKIMRLRAYIALLEQSSTTEAS